MTYALKAARLFDGEAMVDEPIVAVDGTTVVGVGHHAAEGFAVEDLGDVTLLPGLIDCHQHLCFNGEGSLEDQVVGVTDDELAERARANAARALQAGITTIRDLGDRGFVTLALRDEPGLPTILAAGPPLTAVGGHCWFLGGECDGRGALVDAVHDRKRRGCHVVKIMVTGGALTPTFPMWESQFTEDEVHAVVETAHALGLPVAAHCHGVDGLALAVMARVDTIEHCTFYGSSGGPELDEELMNAIADAGMTVSATLGRDERFPVPPFVQTALPIVLEGLGYMRERGARIVVGTDAGIGPGKPHDVLPFAALHLEEIGVTGIELITMLTAAAADACGVGGRKGRLAPGCDADMLAVGGDTTGGSDALHDVRAVWHRGTRVR